MTDETIIQRVREMATAEPSPELRGSVLAAALPLVRPSATWADRVWFSRAWRVATVALVLALFAMERWAGPSPSRVADPPEYAAAEGRAAEEVARDAGMSPDEAKAFGRLAMASATLTPSQLTDPGAVDALLLGEGETR